MDRMVKCGACGKFLGKSPIGAAACSTCNTKFHNGCLALPAKAKVGEDWVCPNCKKNDKRGDNSLTPVRGLASYPGASGSAATDLTDSLKDMSGSPAAGAIDTNVDSLADFRREFVDCIIELRGCQEMALFRETIVDLSMRLTNVEKRLDLLEQGGADGASAEKVVELERTIVVLEGTVQQLKAELNDKDQEALSTDLEIGNVMEPAGENAVHTVSVLASKLGVTLAPADIVFAERVGRSPMGSEDSVNEPKRARRLVVRLARRQLRDELLQAARVRRTLSSADLGVAGMPQRVYINERLTRHNRQLFYRVREECRRLNWRYSWTKRGRIFARQGDGKPVHLIRSSGDLDRVFKNTTV